MEEYKDMNDLEILQSIAGRYNNYKATAALKKWQLSVDFVNAIAGIILGVCPEARQELQHHLNHNKWTESGSSMTIGIYNLCFIWALGKSKMVDVSCLFFLLWPCPGYSESLLRLKRHQLNESPKGLDATWTKILTDSWIEITIS